MKCETRHATPLLLNWDCLNSERSTKVNCLLDSGCDTTMTIKSLSRMLKVKEKKLIDVEVATSQKSKGFWLILKFKVCMPMRLTD